MITKIQKGKKGECLGIVFILHELLCIKYYLYVLFISTLWGICISQDSLGADLVHPVSQSFNVMCVSYIYSTKLFREPDCFCRVALPFSRTTKSPYQLSVSRDQIGKRERQNSASPQFHSKHLFIELFIQQIPYWLT